MLEHGAGTILLINGSSAATPNGRVAGTSTAFAGESAYGAMLHEAAAPRGVNVRQLIIPGAIGGGGLGDLAIRYGYQRFRPDIMLATVVILIVLVQLVQFAGNTLAARLNKK